MYKRQPIGLQVVVWPKSNATRSQVEQEIRFANKIFSPSTIGFYLDSYEELSEEYTFKGFEYDEDHPQFGRMAMLFGERGVNYGHPDVLMLDGKIAEMNNELQVHYIPSLNRKTCGFQWGPAILLQNSRNEKVTLSHEIAHVFGLNHLDKKKPNHLMNRLKKHQGTYLSNTDFAVLQFYAVDYWARQVNGDPPAGIEAGPNGNFSAHPSHHRLIPGR